MYSPSARLFIIKYPCTLVKLIRFNAVLTSRKETEAFTIPSLLVLSITIPDREKVFVCAFPFNIPKTKIVVRKVLISKVLYKIQNYYVHPMSKMKRTIRID